LLKERPQLHTKSLNKSSVIRITFGLGLGRDWGPGFLHTKWFLGASGSEAEQSFANIHGEKTWNRDELKVAGRKFQVLQ
jgi:hypothetical protein